MPEQRQPVASATPQATNSTSLKGLNIITAENESQLVNMLIGAINNSTSISRLDSAITNLEGSISGLNISDPLRKAISGMLLIAHQVKNLNYSNSDVTDGTAKNITELYLQMTDVNTGGYIDINVNGEIKKSFLLNKKDEYGFFAKLKALVKIKANQDFDTKGLALDDPLPKNLHYLDNVDIDLSQPHFE